MAGRTDRQEAALRGPRLSHLPAAPVPRQRGRAAGARRGGPHGSGPQGLPCQAEGSSPELLPCHVPRTQLPCQRATRRPVHLRYPKVRSSRAIRHPSCAPVTNRTISSVLFGASAAPIRLPQAPECMLRPLNGDSGNMYEQPCSCTQCTFTLHAYGTVVNALHNLDAYFRGHPLTELEEYRENVDIRPQPCLNNPSTRSGCTP